MLIRYCRRPGASRPVVFSTLLAGFAALVAVTIAPSPAAAQQGFGGFFSYQPKQKKKRVVRRRAPAAAAAADTAGKTDKKAAEKSAPKGAVYAIVSLPDQHITVYDANGQIARSRISSGMAGHRTPTGVFSVLAKSRFHRSNIYSGAPMPFMQRLTWSGIAMHAGVVPGYPASHGCIRLPSGFAPQLYKMTSMGARVIVTSRDTAPFDFAHPLLPTPKMHEVPAGYQQAAKQDKREKQPIELASLEDGDVTTAAVSDASPDPKPEKPLNPIAYSAVLRDLATAEKTSADKLAAERLEAAQAAGAEAREAVDAARKAEADLAAEQAKATDGKDANVAEAQTALDAARRLEADKTPAAFAAVASWKQAVEAAETANTKLEEAKRRAEQVSVFISRKEGRIFIRQDWKDVWEAPVTFRDPERSIGTHVFTAVEAPEDGSSMRWTAVTIKEPPAAAPRKGKGDDAEPEAAAEKPETAAGALDRIELPEGARERIGDLLWTGGSVIVSDHPRSYEMGDYTDFIVLTR